MSAALRSSAETQMGPLAAQRQRDRVEGYIAKGIADGATLATGGGRPKDLDRGWYVEPTVFGNVDNSSVIAQEEIPRWLRAGGQGAGGRGGGDHPVECPDGPGRVP
jgi:hypothetical protein